MAASLLEREDELAALDAALARARHGEGGLVVVEGAAGIGKTSLLRALRARAEEGGLRLLTARGSELEQTLPYGVARQLFERAVARATPEERDDALSGAAAHAAPLLSAAPGAPAADADAAFAVMHGLYWLAANLAEREPLVLAIDDLHWADATSLRWLAYLARRIEGLPLLALATVRPLESESDPALAELLADPATLTVRPSPLTHEAAAVILAERVGANGASGDLSAAAHAATAGNPLLLRELAGALAGAGAAADAGAVRRLAPEVVSRRVRLELARLGPEATALARAAAVIGDDAACADCAPQLARLDAEQATRAGAALIRAEVLGREGALRFAHPLVRRAVYDAIPEAERGLAHARAARVLHERGASIDRVAAQLVLGSPSGDASSVERLREAARHALATGAAESARTYLRRALDEPPQDAVRADVLVALAGAEGLLGAPEAVEHLRDAIAVVRDPARRAALRHALARGLIWRSEERAAVAEIDIARAEAPAQDAALHRSLSADYFSAALRVPELHEAALARLEQLEVDSADAGGLMLLALKAYAAMVQGERLQEAVSLAERALAGGLSTEHAPSWSLWGAVSTLLHADRQESAARVVDQAIADARTRGAVYLFSGASMVRASILYMSGALLEAEADARAAVEAVPDQRAMIMPLAFGVLSEVLVERGMLDEAAATLTRAGADGTLPESFAVFPLLSARSLLRLAQGDVQAAAADALASGRGLEAVGFHNPALARWRGQAALALLAAGDAGDARGLAEEELALARRWGSARPIGRALRVLGLARGGKPGLALLRESLDVLDTSPAQLERAHTQVELGAALRRAGNRVEARTVLRGGAELAQRCGAQRLAQQAHEELLAAGAKPRSMALSGVESLTPSERRVAAMAAEGLGNREIAQALFVTLRTVEMHMSNAFRKLDVSSRTQLADALARPRRQATLAG